MNTLLLITVWLALSIVIGLYAEGKGRGFLGIFFLSLLLSPLVGFVAALAMRPDERKVAAVEGKKLCPQCAEYVQRDAKICRFCQYKFPELTELEQLKALGLDAGPACLKCGSVNTFSADERVKASRWWKVAKIPRFHCRKCGDAWLAGESSPVETVNVGLIMTVVAFALLIPLLTYAIIHRQRPSNGPSSSPIPSQSHSTPSP